jgi:uncharacterized protein (DUF488 family)
MHVHTIGYGGRTPRELTDLLGGEGIRTVVDVRLRPDRARIGSFARAASADKGIEKLLAGAGVGYVSLVELGNLFRDREDWRGPYRALIERAGDLLLEPLSSIPGPICLLCAEKRVEECHRAILAEALARRGWEVTHIE